MQTASVDLDEYDRAVASPVKAYHLSGRCYETTGLSSGARRESLKAA